MPQPPPAAGAVHDGGLVQLGVDLGQRSQEEDGAPAHLLPDVLQHEQRFGEVRVGHDVGRFEALVAKQLVDEACAAEDLLPQGDDDDPGQEVRQVGGALHQPLDGSVQDAVQHQGQHQRRRKREHQLQQLDGDGIDQRQLEVAVGEEVAEVLQADERAAADAQKRREVLKGDDVAEQWQVFENQEVQRPGHDEQVHPALGDDRVPQARTELRRHVRRGCGSNALGRYRRRTHAESTPAKPLQG